MIFTRTTSSGRLVIVCLAIASLVSLTGRHAAAQQSARRATTPLALLTYPGFFQGQPVVVRGTLATRDRAVLISSSIDRAIPLIFNGTSPADGPVEIRATFWDVGRLQREDPRLANLDLAQLLPNNGQGADWPRPGELVALVVTDAVAVKPASGPPTLRLVALNPEEYVGQRLTLTGQFRGRNLFGDVPQAPSVSQWDFVLHNGDAALWVTGERPRGKGFNLDVGARVDTRTWLQVTGVVRAARGLIWLEGVPPITLAPPDTSFISESLPPPAMGPAPEVIFSDPQDGDTGVPLKAAIRLQFSRDMDPDSFKGHVHWRYAGPAATVSPAAAASPANPANPASAASPAKNDEPPPANLTVKYEKSNRSLEVKITAGADLIRFRNIVLEVTDEVKATDGAKLKPWAISFSFGGE
jgi:hypothetical protein